MAEMVSSAVAQEAVHHILYRFKERYEHTSDAKERMERMEMAHIRLEAALETSHRWSVTSAPLLRWRSKLKRAAQECDHTLRRCRQRLQEEEQTQQQVKSSSFPKRIAHATRSLVSSVFGGGGDAADELGGSAAVRRFERFADGASEFLRYVELGGAPRRFVSFDIALVRHLLDGKGTKHCFVDGGQHVSFAIQPFSPPDQGMEGALIFMLEDGNAPENNFLLTLSLRLSESTDIIGIVVRCLELFTPHLMTSTTETVKGKLTLLPTQDLCWVPDAHYVFGRDQHRDNFHTISSKWYRPNPLCCQQQVHHYSTQRYADSSSCTLPEPLGSDIYLEQVTQVYLLGHVTLLAGSNRQNVVANGEARDFRHLKLGVNFWPHGSSKDLPHAVGGSATETIDGEATQFGLYANISLKQLGEIVLPKAVDFLRQDVAATSYQNLWKSKHGRAYLQVEKTSSWRATTRREHRGASRGKKKLQGWTSGISEFMSSWVAHAPAHLQASAVDWIQKQKRLPQPLLLKASSCAQDCPIMQLSLQDLRFWQGRSSR